MEEETLNKARQVAMRYLSGRDRSVHQVRQKLVEKEFAAAIVDQVIADLERHNLVDDRALAHRWVQVRVEGKGAGPAKLAQDLRRRGISQDIVKDVLEEFADILSSADAAADLLRKQRRRYVGIEKHKAQQRMNGFLARRGYQGDVVSKAVKQVWEEIREHDLEGD